MMSNQLKNNETEDVLGVIGQIACINVARAGQPAQLRYYGKGKGCSGQAHRTADEAKDDVRNWYAGKPVLYEQHAVVPLATLPPIPSPTRLKRFMQWLKMALS